MEAQGHLRGQCQTQRHLPAYVHSALRDVSLHIWSSHRCKHLLRCGVPLMSIHWTLSSKEMRWAQLCTWCRLLACRFFQSGLSGLHRPRLIVLQSFPNKLHRATEGTKILKTVYGLKYIPDKAVILCIPERNPWNPSAHEKLKPLILRLMAFRYRKQAVRPSLLWQWSEQTCVFLDSPTVFPGASPCAFSWISLPNSSVHFPVLWIKWGDLYNRRYFPLNDKTPKNTRPLSLKNEWSKSQFLPNISPSNQCLNEVVWN